MNGFINYTRKRNENVIIAKKQKTKTLITILRHK